MSTNRTAHSISENSSETGWVPIEQLIRFQNTLLKPDEYQSNSSFDFRILFWNRMSTNRTAHSISEYSSKTGWVPIDRTPNVPPVYTTTDSHVCVLPSATTCSPFQGVYTVELAAYIPIFTQQRRIHWRQRIRTFAGVQTVQHRIHKIHIFTRLHRWVGYTGAPCQVIFDRSRFSCVLHNESIRVKFCAFKKVHFGHRFYFLQIAQPFSVMSRVADAGVWHEPNRGSVWSASVEIFVKPLFVTNQYYTFKKHAELDLFILLREAHALLRILLVCF